MLPKISPPKSIGRHLLSSVRPLAPLHRNKSAFICGHNTEIRSNFASSAFQGQRKPRSGYEQIPEHLKIHMFTPELEILRNDELRAPFKSFSSSFILQLLEQRSNEIRLEKGNSNPKSRLNNDNVVRFMKVLLRLRQLFNLNGGNTEVLDAVLHSQSAVNSVEAKLAAKKRAKLEEIKRVERDTALYAPGPYVQIPESLELHDFAEELAVLQRDELKRKFTQLSAWELISLLEKRLKEVHEEGDRALGAGINKQNLVRFYNLLPRLKKLLAWNGGVTAVLDTLLESQGVFNKIEERIKAKSSKIIRNQEVFSYKQIPDDVFLEEYCEELKEVRLKLDAPFASVSSDDILEKVKALAEEASGTEKVLNFSKLYRNLAMLFKHNGGHTFVLDTVLLNNTVFNKFESKLKSKAARTVEFVANSSVSDAGTRTSETQTKFRGLDHVIALLNDLHGTETTGQNALCEGERTIQSALAHALSKEEKMMLEKDPTECEEVINLTPAKVRGKCRPKTGPEQIQKGQIQKGQIRKEQIEKYLKKIKENKDIADGNKWREQTAYEWSTAHCNSQRSFEARNFFDPVVISGHSGKHTDFPMFPGFGAGYEYVILTSNGQKFHTLRNPLGVGHVPENMMAVLQTLSEDELAKFSRNIEILRRKGWQIIGPGQSKGMLVLSREVKSRGVKVGESVQFLLSASGLCFITLLSVNWLIDDKSVDEMGQVILLNTAEGTSEYDLSDNSDDGNNPEGASWWKGLLWK